MTENIKQERFESYGTFSENNVPITEQNGRYLAQAASEKLIFADALNKLDLKPHNRLLDIGCGMGSILIPASFTVSHVTGVDHPKVIERLKGFFKPQNCDFVGENFLDFQSQALFDRISVYSVLAALPDRETVIAFVNKALDLLSPDGRALLSDIPNTDKKKRFTESRRGKIFSEYWDRIMSENPSPAMSAVSTNAPAASFDDQFIMEICTHIRQRGFEAFLMRQPQALPFGNTREDILIIGPEYDDGTLNIDR